MTIRNAWEDGIASGDAGPLDFTELKAEAHNNLAEAIRRRLAPFGGVELEPHPPVSGRKSAADMARLYDISQPTVSRIVSEYRVRKGP